MFTGHQIVLWTSVFVVASLSSCGGAPSRADQACADLAEARCDKLTTCTDGTGIDRTWGDMNTCLVREKLACTIGLRGPGTGNNPVLVEECIAALPALSCADFLDNKPPVDCVAVGSRAIGAPCAFSGQCSSSYCGGAKVRMCGTCQQTPIPGTPCLDTECGYGQECIRNNGLCEPPNEHFCGLVGIPCRAGLSCVVGDDTLGGSCMPAVVTVGAPCGGMMAGCDSTIGLYCGGPVGSQTCMSIISVADGMPCGPLPDGTFKGCAGAATCYRPKGAIGDQPGTCKKPAADGAPCDTGLGPGCLPPARCITVGNSYSGKCVVPAGDNCG
jgi:hypothetical protein